MENHYLKRYWNETRGDKFDHWGTSVWYFETDKKGNVIRQIEEYAVGIRLTYDQKYKADNYGLLSDTRLYLADPEFEKINRDDFDKKWREGNPAICKTIDDETLTIAELEKIEISLPISDTLYNELWSTDSIEKLQDVPMKNGPIQDINETMLLNEGLTTVLKFLETNKVNFSESVLDEFDSFIDFISTAETEGKAIQFWV